MKNNYFEKIGNLLKEAFKFSKYKKMPKALAVMTFIVMLPAFVVFVALIAALAVLAFVVDMLESPIESVYNFMHKEGQEVKHGTQVVIYLISWPVVFLLHSYEAFIDVFFRLAYIPVAVVGYFWTLCGFKFHVSLDAQYELPEPEEIKKGRPLAFVLVTYILGFLAIVAKFLPMICKYVYNNVKAFVFCKILGITYAKYFALALPIILAVLGVFVVLFTLIAYRNKKQEAPAKKAK